MRYYDWWVYIILASPGIFVFVTNWASYIISLRGRFVSGIPLFAGLWIAGVCLISPCKWLALIGLADTGVWLLIVALIRDFLIPHKKPQDDTPEDDGQEQG